MGKGGLLGFLGWGRTSDPPVSLVEFRERIADEIVRRYAGVHVERVGDDGLETFFPDGDQPGFLNLARNYAAYREGRNDLAWFIEHNASNARRKAVKATPESLVMLVRPDNFNPDAGGEGDDDRGLIKPLVDYLIAIVAIDAPESYTYAHASTLRRELKMTDSEIWQRALVNTRARIDFDGDALEPGKICEIVTGVGLASSLLAEDEIWDSTEMTALGPLLVSPIERDRLVFAPLNDKSAVTALRNWHSKYQPNSEWLADILIVRREGRWELAT